jgi:flagellar biosynthesis protein FlhA
MQGDVLHVVTISSEMELDIHSAIQKTEFGNYLARDPEKATRFIETLQERAMEFERYGSHPIILTSPSIRMFVRQLTERYFPDIPILSYNELMPSIEVKSIRVI